MATTNRNRFKMRMIKSGEEIVNWWFCCNSKMGKATELNAQTNAIKNSFSPGTLRKLTFLFPIEIIGMEFYQYIVPLALELISMN